MSLSPDDRPQVHTASATLTPRHHGLLNTNRGAAGAVTLTLPAGQKGMRIRARKVTAQTFTLARAGSDTILNSAGGSVTSLAINVSAELVHDGTAWLVDSEVPAASGTVATAQLADLSVTTGKIAAGEVTGAKLSPTGIASGGFTGSNGAGVCTLTGAVVGQRVLAVMETTATVALGVAAALFESTITVADQIQQSSVANNSAKRYVVILASAAA